MCKDNYEQSAFHVHVHGCSRLLHLIFMSSSDLHEKPPAKRRRLVQSHDSSRLPEMASTNPANDDHLREDEESEEDDLTTDTEGRDRRQLQKSQQRVQALNAKLKSNMTVHLPEQMDILKDLCGWGIQLAQRDFNQSNSPLVLLLAGVPGSGKSSLFEQVIKPALLACKYTVHDYMAPTLNEGETFGVQKQVPLLKEMKALLEKAALDEDGVAFLRVEELGLGTNNVGQMAFWSRLFTNDVCSEMEGEEEGEGKQFEKIDVSKLVIIATTNIGEKALLSNGAHLLSYAARLKKVDEEFQIFLKRSGRQGRRILGNIIPFRAYSHDEAVVITQRILRSLLESISIQVHHYRLVGDISKRLAEVCVALWFKQNEGVGMLKKMLQKKLALLTNSCSDDALLDKAKIHGFTVEFLLESNVPHLALRIADSDSQLLGKAELSSEIPPAFSLTSRALPSAVQATVYEGSKCDRFGRSHLWMLCANAQLAEVEREIKGRTPEYLGETDLRGRTPLMAAAACEFVGSPVQPPSYRLSPFLDDELVRRASIIRQLLQKMLPDDMKRMDLTGADASLLLLQAVNWQPTEEVNAILASIWASQGRPWQSLQAVIGCVDTLRASRTVDAVVCMEDLLTLVDRANHPTVSDEEKQALTIYYQYRHVTDGYQSPCTDTLWSMLGMNWERISCRRCAETQGSPSSEGDTNGIPPGQSSFLFVYAEDEPMHQYVVCRVCDARIPWIFPGELSYISAAADEYFALRGCEQDPCSFDNIYGESSSEEDSDSDDEDETTGSSDSDSEDVTSSSDSDDENETTSSSDSDGGEGPSHASANDGVLGADDSPSHVSVNDGELPSNVSFNDDEGPSNVSVNDDEGPIDSGQARGEDDEMVNLEVDRQSGAGNRNPVLQKTDLSSTSSEEDMTDDEPCSCLDDDLATGKVTMCRYIDHHLPQMPEATENEEKKERASRAFSSFVYEWQPPALGPHIDEFEPGVLGSAAAVARRQSLLWKLVTQNVTPCARMNVLGPHVMVALSGSMIPDLGTVLQGLCCDEESQRIIEMKLNVCRSVQQQWHRFLSLSLPKETLCLALRDADYSLYHALTDGTGLQSEEPAAAEPLFTAKANDLRLVLLRYRAYDSLLLGFLRSLFGNEALPETIPYHILERLYLWFLGHAIDKDGIIDRCVRYADQLHETTVECQDIFNQLLSGHDFTQRLQEAAGRIRGMTTPHFKFLSEQGTLLTPTAVETLHDCTARVGVESALRDILRPVEQCMEKEESATPVTVLPTPRNKKCIRAALLRHFDVATNDELLPLLLGKTILEIQALSKFSLYEEDQKKLNSA